MSKLIPLTKGYHAIVDDDDYERLIKFKWHVLANSKRQINYAATAIRIDGRYRNVRIHRMILNLSDQRAIVDHANGDGLDNRRVNLRVCSLSQNGANSTKHCGFSKFKGVSFNKKNKKWTAMICKNREIKFLGYYSNEVDAALAYNHAALSEFGEFARINEIGKGK